MNKVLYEICTTNILRYYKEKYVLYAVQYFKILYTNRIQMLYKYFQILCTNNLNIVKQKTF